MKRTPLRRRPKPRGTDIDAAGKWFLAVTRRKKCVVCGREHPHMQGHHVIPQSVLRAEFPFGVGWDMVDGRWVAITKDDQWTWTDAQTRSLQDLLWDERNGIPLCPTHHELHTGGHHRVPRAALPLPAFQFAEELGLLHRLGDRFYGK